MVLTQEAQVSVLKGARCFGKIDLLQGYWQTPLKESARELFTIVTPEGLLMPTRVPQGLLNCTGYSQAVVVDILHGLNCTVWVHDMVGS